MASQRPYSNGQGDIEQAKKKLQGRMPSLGQPVAGDPARAAQMQSQFAQPVTNGFSPLQAPLAPAAGAIDRRGANPAGEPYPGPEALQQRRVSLADAVASDAGRRSIDDALRANAGPGVMPGNPARAARMQAQFAQPVTIGRAVQPLPVAPVAAGVSAPGNGMRETLGSGIGGAAKSLAGALGYIPSAVYDGVRNAAGSLSDGDTSQIQQYRTGAAALVGEGLEQMTDSAATLRNNAAVNTRDALNINQIPADSTPRAKPVAAAGENNSSAAQAVKPSKPRTPAAPNAGGESAQPTSNGYTQTGIGGVVGRTGANGVPEFTNNQAAASGAGALPAGGIGAQPLRTPGISNMADDLALERRGSINNIGNGIGGGLSVGEDGDSQLALGRFERANQIRAEMNAGRPRELGDNGNRLTVVRDSSRTPSLQERQLARLDERTTRTESLRNRDSLDQQRLGYDMSSGEREYERSLANDRLGQQKTRQEIEAGGLALDSDVRMNSLRAQLADPAITGEQRATLERAYRSLSTPGDKRFITVAGGTNDFGGKDASKVFDTLDQSYVDAGGNTQEGQSGALQPGQEKGGYIFLGGDPSDKSNWRAK